MGRCASTRAVPAALHTSRAQALPQRVSAVLGELPSCSRSPSRLRSYCAPRPTANAARRAFSTASTMAFRSGALPVSSLLKMTAPSW